MSKKIREFKTGATRDTEEEKLDYKINIAWAVGFYDGEGSITCTSNNGRKYQRLQISIGQKDHDGKIADTLVKFKNIVKCGYIYQKNRTGKENNQHQFFVTKLKDVNKVINLLWNNLSISKKEQIIKALNLYKIHHRGYKHA